MKHLLWILLMLAVCAAISAQEVSISDSTATRSVALVMKDSMAFKVMPKDSVADGRKKDESVPLYAKFRPNPHTSLWLALAIPGAGQIYNRKYWKLPIVYGLGVGVGYAIAYTNRNYQDYRNAYQSYKSSQPKPELYEPMVPNGYPASSYSSYFKTQMDNFRRERDISIVAAVVAYALSVIDAFVDAQLSDFDVSPDLSIKVTPEVQQINNSQAVGVGAAVKF